MAEVAGPLGNALTVNGTGRGARLGGDLSTANALMILRRCAVVEEDERSAQLTLLKEATLAWAVTTNLGQPEDPRPEGPETLLAAAHRRRVAALKSLIGAGLRVETVRLVPHPALLTGTGEAGVQEIGIALHGTYGWPVLRGSTLKGMTHAYARDHCDPPMPRNDRAKLFGAPRAGEDDEVEAEPGSVAFLDALPYRCVPVRQHVLTPHATDYYEHANRLGRQAPPAEYDNPVPVPFLAVEGHRQVNDSVRECGFFVALVGTDDSVGAARKLLCEAAAEIGAGAKTAAGYGYLREAGVRR